MHLSSTGRGVGFALSLIAATLVAGMMLRGTSVSQTTPAISQKTQFTGRVLSASGPLVVGGEATQPGHPVVGATVHLVPVTAIDITTRMTASAIYASPYPAEEYDEPLEDAIRTNGAKFPRSITNSRGDFVIANVPNGKFFIHVTPGPEDTEHLPGGDQSRRSYAAEQLRGRSMTIKVSSSPSRASRYVGSSSCLACHKDKTHWQQTAHKLGWTVPGKPGPMQDFSRHSDYFDALESFPSVDDYTRGTRLELGDYDAGRGDDKFKLRAFGDSRLPIETPYADVYLWKNARDSKYYITIVNRLNAQDPIAPRTWRSNCCMAGLFTTSGTSCRFHPDWETDWDGIRYCGTT